MWPWKAPNFNYHLARPIFSRHFCSAPQPVCCFQTYKHLERKGVPNMVLSALLSSPESWIHKSQPSWKLSNTFRHFFFPFPLFSYSQRNVRSDIASQLVCNSLFLSPHNIQFSSVTQSCPTLCDPRDCSTPGLPVHHQLPESIQTHVHQVDDAIQPSHPLSSPSPPATNPSQHQGLFQ